MVHRVEMLRAERLGTDEERKRRLSADCSLEKVADEVDLSCDGCCTIYKERRKAFYKASRAVLYRKTGKTDETGSTVTPCTTKRSIACPERAMRKENEAINDVNFDVN